MKVKVTIPTSLKEIKLSQYQKFLKILNENEESEFLSLKMIEIFCGVSLNVANSMAKKDLNEATRIIGELFTKVPPLIKQFEFEGKTFGFHPNLDELSSGEYMDLDNYSTAKDWQDMHYALGVLYRPITKTQKDKYLIEPYESARKYGEAFKDMSLEVALSAIVFFYRLGNDLLISTMDSLMANQVDLLKLGNSGKDGDGIPLSMDLLKGMLGDLMKLQNYQYTNA